MSCDTNQKQIYSKSKFHVTQKAMKSIKDIKLEHIQQLFHDGINRIGIVHYILDLFLWEHINIPVRKFTNWLDFVHFNIIYLRTNPNKPTWWASQLSAHKYTGPQINWWTFYKVLVKSDFTSEEKIIKFQRDRSCFFFFFFFAYRRLYYWAPGLQQVQLPLHEQIFNGVMNYAFILWHILYKFM